MNCSDKHVFGGDLIHNINTLVKRMDLIEKLKAYLETNNELILSGMSIEDLEFIANDLKKGVYGDSQRKLDIFFEDIVFNSTSTYSIIDFSGEVKAVIPYTFLTMRRFAKTLQKELDKIYPNELEVLVTNDCSTPTLKHITIIDVERVKPSTLSTLLFSGDNDYVFDWSKSTSSIMVTSSIAEILNPYTFKKLLDKIESLVKKVEDLVDSVETDIKTNASNIAKNTESIEETNKKVGDINQSLENHDDKIKALEYYAEESSRRNIPYTFDFQLPKSNIMHFASSLLPTENIGGQTYRLIPVDITTQNTTNLYVPSLFEPLDADHGGITKYKFIGESPMYGNVIGSIQALLRIPTHFLNNYEIIDRDYALWFVCENAPEHSANAGGMFRRFLSTSFRDSVLNGNYIMFDKKLSAYTSNDPINPPSYDREETIENSKDSLNIFNGSENGAIAVNSKDGLLVNTDDYKTSNWMEISEISKRTGLVYVLIKRISTICRVQFYNKDTDEYFYDSKQSGNKSSNRFIKVPLGYTHFRITFSNLKIGDLIPDSDIYVIPQEEEVSWEYDPSYGCFIPFSFNINQPVIFYPDAIYSLGINPLMDTNNDPEPLKISGKSVRILSGGLTFNMFGRPDIKDVNSVL